MHILIIIALIIFIGSIGRRGSSGPLSAFSRGVVAVAAIWVMIVVGAFLVMGFFIVWLAIAFSFN